jgi:transcriptional regulator with XRE-family HTH domain
MDKISEILKELRAAAGLSQIDVSDKLAALGVEVTNKTVSKWEQGSSKPDALTLLRLCRIYGVRDPCATFIGSEIDLNLLGLQKLDEYAALLRLDPRFVRQQKISPVRIIPLYDMPVSAGTGVFLDESEYTEIEIDDSVPEEADFALRVMGETVS